VFAGLLRSWHSSRAYFRDVIGKWICSMLADADVKAMIRGVKKRSQSKSSDGHTAYSRHRRRNRL
jgi:hypothetical protein